MALQQQHEQGSYFQQQTTAPPDLHDLVTSHLDTTDAEPFPSSSVSIWTSHAASALPNHPSSLRRHGSSVHPAPTLDAHSHPSSSSLSSFASSRRRSQPYSEAPQMQIQTAEKAGDNPTSTSQSFSFDPEPAVSTPSRLNRLFAGPTSPTSSRETSYRKRKDGKPYVRSFSNDTASLSTHLYTRGLLGGRHSDITVHVFGHGYALHRIILDRAPFFASALSEPWLEASAKEITLHPEDIDPSITRITFELALRRLYGCHSQAEEELEARGLFATGCWLEMQDLIEASTTAILRQLQTKSLGQTVQQVTNSYYGRPGEKILASAKAMLCRDGWSMPLAYWDSIPSDVIRELVGGDCLFIPGEWERWILARRILDRKLRSLAIEAGLLTPNCIEAPKMLQHTALRPHSAHGKDLEDALAELSAQDARLVEWFALYTHADIEPLLELLDDGIYYMHLGFEHLQLIREARDCLGVPLIPDNVISNALWKSLELRQNILNANDTEDELGLTFALPESGFAEEGNLTAELAAATLQEPQARKYWIPSADCNIVIGGSGDPVVTASHAGPQRPSSSKRSVQHADAVQWFSDFMKERSQATSASTPDLRPETYSTFPPFRFAADFPNPRTMKEKKRVYSQTVFYAGSYWHVYIQKVRTGTKTPQLGVYLHRTRNGESLAETLESVGRATIPSSSGAGARGSVDDRIGALEREMLVRSERRSRRHSDRHLSGNTVYSTTSAAEFGAVEGNSRSSGPDADANDPNQASSTSNIPTINFPNPSMGPSTAGPDPFNFGSSSCLDSASSSPESAQVHYVNAMQPQGSQLARRLSKRRQHLTATAQTVPALPPYTDSRPTVKTYFKIYSPSKGGRMLSVYESAPDSFNFSESWGWKSSTLMVDDADLSAASQASAGSGLDSSATAGLGFPSAYQGGPGDYDDGEMREGREFEGDDDFGDEERDRLPSTDGKLRFMIVLGVV